MLSDIAKNKDTVTGLIFVLFGAASLYFSADYATGTTARMGPGYFPKIVGGAILVLGLIISVRGLRASKEGNPFAGMALKPLFWLTLVIALFGLFVDRVGLVVAAPMLVILARLGGHDVKRFLEIGVLAVLATAAAAALFVFGLGVPIPLLPY